MTRLETLVCFYFIFGTTNISFTVILRVGTEMTRRTPGTRQYTRNKQGLETRLYDVSRDLGMCHASGSVGRNGNDEEDAGNATSTRYTRNKQGLETTRLETLVCFYFIFGTTN
jgi:hypothetical protein